MSIVSSGADYRRRLKRDQEQVQDLREAAPEPVSTELADSSERRGNSRYKCEGSATFRVQGSTVRSWGTFTDLSISGCYVELKATFPVGALIDLELELNGIRAQITGEVQVSYPFLGRGVAFRNVSAENRRLWADMIDSVRPSIRKMPVTETGTVLPATSLPIILNAGAALQALADFFEAHTLLPKEEFMRILRKSQGL